MLLHPVAEAMPGDTPPADPADGSLWLIAAAPVGAWTGNPNRVAGWTAGGWRFFLPAEGMRVWCRASGLELRFVDGSWRTPEGVAMPTGGSVVDTEAREALAALAARLTAAGLLA